MNKGEDFFVLLWEILFGYRILVIEKWGKKVFLFRTQDLCKVNKEKTQEKVLDWNLLPILLK